VVTPNPVSLSAVAADERDVPFEAYVGARQHALLRTAFLLTGDLHEAEDLLQAALARLYPSWKRVSRAQALDAYVRRAMVNQYTSWWRRAWRQRETSVEAIDDRTSGGIGLAEQVTERDALWHVVRQLPPRQRAAVVLRFYEDLSEVETAAVLGCSVGTVKSTTSRALAALRRHMEAEERHER
jgi:RNA polymerase sigma-70 factor (sigma-E family)